MIVPILITTLVIIMAGVEINNVIEKEIELDKQIEETLNTLEKGEEGGNNGKEKVSRE